VAAGSLSRLPSQPRVPARLCHAGVGALLGAAAAVGCIAAVTSPRVVTGGARSTRHGLASLPVAARGPVSAALGRDEAAYRVLGLRAINPAQRLRVSFSRRNVTVASGRARIAMTLSTYGQGRALQPLASVAAHVSANRVTYPHGILTEWFANGPLGLEQGFDVAARPSSGSGPLTLSSTLSGNLHPRLQHGVLLLDGAGVALRYGALSATDARGRPLRSWLQLSGDRLLVRVYDRGAAYPLRIDPLIQQDELAASHGARGEEFGESVSISGDTIVVGTPNYVVASTNLEQGAAYVFTRSHTGWAHATQVARLIAAKGQSEELFGHSVSVSGNTIVVGAPFREVGEHTGQGAAYVFVRSTSGWSNATPTAKLTGASGQAHEFFGESVAVSGRTIVVGAPSRKVGKNAMQGAADVFTTPASGWAGSMTERAELTVSGGQANDALGISVAVSGNTIVAGADLHAVGKSTKQGAAYVFVKPASGWSSITQKAELTDENGEADELFGHSVAVSGETIVVGAPDHEVGKDVEQGVAYVFTMPASGWVGSLAQPAVLSASDGAKDEVLGRSLAISGNTIVAGASSKQVGKNAEQGAVYVFEKPASGWADITQTAELSASDGTAGDSLGRSVAASGETIAAGAPDHEVRRVIAQGAVYAFTLSRAGAPGRLR
jgi:hypothetical protein